MRDVRRSGLACGSRDRDGNQEREPSTWKSKLICYRFRSIPHVFPLFRTTGNSDPTAAKFTQLWIGGTEAIDHEAETLLRKKTHITKSVLRLPDLEHAKTAVLNSLTILDAQRGYRHAIDAFVDWYRSEPRLALNRMVVLRYRSHLESRQLAPGTVNLPRGAVRRLAYEAADCGLLSADLAAGRRHVKGVQKLGVRLGNWLTS